MKSQTPNQIAPPASLTPPPALALSKPQSTSLSPAPSPQTKDSLAAAQLNRLGEQQRDQLRLWLAEHPYDQVIDLVRSHFGINPPFHVLDRYVWDKLPDGALDGRRSKTAPIKGLATLATLDPLPYRLVALEQLEACLARMSLAPQANLKGISTIFKLLLQQQELNLKEKEFALRAATTLSARDPQFPTKSAK